MNIAIIGCGLIGNKRANALNNKATLVYCSDLKFDLAQKLANNYFPCKAVENWQDIINKKDVDLIIIATNHLSLPEISLAAVKAGKHVLVEKPAACRSSDLNDVIDSAKKNNDSIRWICEYLNLSPQLNYSGGDRGWIGDNPFIFLDTAKINKLGWKPKLSIKEGIIQTVKYLENNKWVFEEKI